MATSVSKPYSQAGNTLEAQYSRRDIAEMLGVGESTVRRWISTGQLKAYRYGPRVIRVDAADLRRFRTQLAAPTYAHVSGGGAA